MNPPKVSRAASRWASGIAWLQLADNSAGSLLFPAQALLRPADRVVAAWRLVGYLRRIRSAPGGGGFSLIWCGSRAIAGSRRLAFALDKCFP
jgi:hypothetical protein